MKIKEHSRQVREEVVEKSEATLQALDISWSTFQSFYQKRKQWDTNSKTGLGHEPDNLPKSNSEGAAECPCCVLERTNPVLNNTLNTPYPQADLAEAASKAIP